MQAAPLAALIPLLVMVYVIGLTSKVFVVCIMAIPVIVLNTTGAVRNTPTNLKEMAYSFLGTERDIILKVVIPSASPIIFSGIAQPPNLRRKHTATHAKHHAAAREIVDGLRHPCEQRRIAITGGRNRSAGVSTRSVAITIALAVVEHTSLQ